MKHLKLACFLFISSIAMAQAPGFHYGYRFSVGESRLSIPNTPSEVGRLAVSGGFSSAFQFTNMIGVTGDVIFNQKGGFVNSSAENRLYQDRFDLYTAEIPVALKFSIPLNDSYFFRIYGGPSVNFNVAARESREFYGQGANGRSYRDRPMDDMEAVHYSMVFGAGIEYITRKDNIFFIDARGNEGLTPVGKIYGQNATMSSYTVGIGLLF